MIIELYKNNSLKNEVNKILTNKLELSGNLINDCDLVDVDINVGLNTNIMYLNYVYIPAFERYYFIEDIVVNNKMMNLKLHCDVLMSYRADILTSKGVVTRSKNGDSYIPDNMILQTKKIKRQCQRIGTSFTKLEKFVIQLGG